MSANDSQGVSWIVCPCSNCSGHLEFDASYAGTTIQCPHCGLDTILFVPPILETEKSSDVPAPLELTDNLWTDEILAWLRAEETLQAKLLKTASPVARFIICAGLRD